MTFQGRSIWVQSVDKAQYSHSIVFSLRRVARWIPMRWETFCHLPEQEQAGYIAHYETEMRLSALEHAEQQRQNERKQRRARAAAQMQARHRRR